MLEECDLGDELVVLVSPLLCELGVRHGFTTRGPRDTADFTTFDAPAHAPLRHALDADDTRTVRVSQVHGAAVHVAGESTLSEAPCADALVSASSDDLLAIRTADCVPILLADARGAVVAAVHAGWKGLLAGVISTAVGEMRARGAQEPLTAAVGPCIGGEAFEVGDEVVARFVEAGLEDVVHQRAGSTFVELSAAAQRHLHSAGVSPERIDTTDACTYRDVARFFSHRRDVTHNGASTTGRMAALIAAAPS